MRNRYNIILGIALLVAVGAGYFFNLNRYVHLATKEEISEEMYHNLDSRKNWRVEWHYNYEAGFTAALTTIGLGLLLTGLYSAKRKESRKHRGFVSN
jgi:hypothetical protein